MPSDVAITCPDCRVPMDAGCIPDHGHSAAFIPGWQSTDAIHPAPRFLAWMMGAAGDRAIQFARNQRFIPITSYRCPRCGLLREYARDTE
jgi:hypothetical protein